MTRKFQGSCAAAITGIGRVRRPNSWATNLLAYFGYPQAHEDDAERAVRAGLDLVAKVSQLLLPTGDLLQVRVGIATGLVIVGDTVGEESAPEQMVVGETPNLAFGLQSVAAPPTPQSWPPAPSDCWAMCSCASSWDRSNSRDFPSR